MPPLRAPALVFALAFAATLGAQEKPDAFGGTLGSNSPAPFSSSARPAPSKAPKGKQAARKVQPTQSGENGQVPFDGPGGPGSGTFRDGSGSISESISTGVDGRSTTRRDARGNIKSTGSVSPDGKSTTYRDGSGRIVGNVQVNPDGDRSTARDSSGRIQYTTSTSGTRTTYRGPNGLIIGTKDITPAGNVVYRNARGEITGPNFK